MSGEPGPPVLLTSLASAALLDGRGDLELRREMRGTVVDWGGVIGQCVRLTGPWRLTLWDGTHEGSLPGSFVASERIPGGWSSRHRWNGYELVQQVVASGEFPGVVRTLRCSRTEASPGPLTVTSSFVPYLLPVLVEGIRPATFRIETSDEEIRIRQRGFGLTVRSNIAPEHLALNGASWIGGKHEGRVDGLELDYAVPVPATGSFEWRSLIAGGLDREIDRGGDLCRAIVADPGASASAIDTADRAWQEATPTLRFPDAPALEHGYELARSALRRLYSAPGDGLTGLVAGYPWYAALWGRDLAWMLGAVVWLGDFDWADRSIATALRFQSRRSVPILAGEPGELAMQVSPGPIFFYGTSDTTLYYPLLIERLARHAGTATLPPERADAVRQMVAWGQHRTDPGTGLLRNGGVAEEISAATASLARVRAGINAPDTTIWDSADRRDHAIDVQVLWMLALRAAADLGAAETPETGAQWRAAADRLSATIRTQYRWPAEGYLYDSIRAGRPKEELRPNALRTVGAGIFSAEEERGFVRRASRDDLSTPWGLRTLSARDPAYDPIAYHGGQVWTIATAWAAEAALAAGEADLGVHYLSTIASLFGAEGGWANECYRGDRREPFDSCFLLGFSVAPFLNVLFHRLWGLDVDARAGRLTVRPMFPAGWHRASIDRLRIGAGSVALDWSPDRLRVRWNGPGALTVRTGSDERSVPDSTDVEIATRP